MACISCFMLSMLLVLKHMYYVLLRTTWSRLTQRRKED
jgi:hypothetical protein